VNSCGECITSSHRTWWNLCEPGKYTRESGQNTREWSRPYNKRVVMWIVSSNSSGNNPCEVQFSILGNMTGIPWFFFYKHKISWSHIAHRSDISNDKHSYFNISKETILVLYAVQCRKLGVKTAKPMCVIRTQDLLNTKLDW
jgi:hypothetical protein